MVKKGRFLRACLGKWRKMSTKLVFPTFQTYCQWVLKEEPIPRDVPKGHLVVYVGEKQQRFVIKLTLLNHPLFEALLDQARDEYDFTLNSKLCIPCHETIFLNVIHSASASASASTQQPITFLSLPNSF